jgi:hypothetical protein
MQERDAYSVAEYCEREGFSSGYLYSEWRAGRGPVYMRNGDRRTISREAAADYRREREAATLAARLAAPRSRSAATFGAAGSTLADRTAEAAPVE